MADDVLTRNGDGELAVRTVQSTGDNYVNPNDVYTRDNDGKLCVRTIGNGGGDSHNKGYYATPEALRTAYPTAEAGDFAIVESTDTIWIWDTDNSEWVDSHKTDSVTSVNGQTGAVVLGAEDVGAVPQYETMPTADASNADLIVQFVGATDTYTNGYFYKCTGAGEPVVYSWSQVDVQPQPVIPDPLPSQTGQSGKFLTTDGTNASWGGALVNKGTGTLGGIYISYNNDGTDSSQNIVRIGDKNVGSGIGNYSVAIGFGTKTGSIGTSKRQVVAIGYYTSALEDYCVVVGCNSTAGASYAIQLGYNGTNSDANTFKVANANGNFEMMSADGTIPTDRLAHAINKYSTMPTATSTNEGWIVQYTGTTDANYTHGYIYECVSDGGNPATYSWTQTDVQPSGLQNTATGTGALTILGTATNQNNAINIGNGSSVVSVADIAIGNDATANGQMEGSVAIGDTAQALGAKSVAIGTGSSAQNSASIAIGYASGALTGDSDNYSICIGSGAKVNATNAIQLGSGQYGSGYTNSDANTFKVANANGNFEMMDANGNLPADRIADTTGLTAGNYLPRLTIDAQGNKTITWVAE